MAQIRKSQRDYKAGRIIPLRAVLKKWISMIINLTKTSQKQFQSLPRHEAKSRPQITKS